MPNEPLNWPQCTRKGCGHSIAHPDEDSLRATVVNNQRWVDKVSGAATCVCHGYSPRALYHPFPCDQSFETARSDSLQVPTP